MEPFGELAGVRQFLPTGHPLLVLLPPLAQGRLGLRPRLTGLPRWSKALAFPAGPAPIDLVGVLGAGMTVRARILLRPVGPPFDGRDPDMGLRRNGRDISAERLAGCNAP
jgi:hypothetical protein